MFQHFLRWKPFIENVKHWPINWVYEKDDLNFTQCEDVLDSGLTRFHPSVIAFDTWKFDTLFGYPKRTINIEDRPDKYIIASGVRTSPDQWAHPVNGKSLFDFLNTDYLTDLRNGRAMLLLDQSLEGYHTYNLWDWFHAELNRLGIPEQALIYVTGDLNCQENYKRWADANNKLNRINLIGVSHFEQQIARIARNQNLKKLTRQDYDYKAKNYDKIKTFNCLQKRSRVHRNWFFVRMFEAGILDKGLVSTNDFGPIAGLLDGELLDPQRVSEARKYLPMRIKEENNTEKDDNFYITRIKYDVCLDSWVSVISEAGFEDNKQNCFISEKTFKAIACGHPFIILGNKGSLRRLRELGYKTFDGFIDESYDSLPSHERMLAIIQELKNIDAIPNKLAWYKGMKEIIKHNRRVLFEKEFQRPPESIEVIKYYNRYFAGK